jgi:hypothetical protein
VRFSQSARQTCPRRENATSAPKTTENAIDNRISDALNWLAGGLRLRQCDMPASIACQTNFGTGRRFRIELHKETASAPPALGPSGVVPPRGRRHGWSIRMSAKRSLRTTLRSFRIRLGSCRHRHFSLPAPHDSILCEQEQSRRNINVPGEHLAV